MVNTYIHVILADRNVVYVDERAKLKRFVTAVTTVIKQEGFSKTMAQPLSTLYAGNV
jgi:hypothetical protein